MVGAIEPSFKGMVLTSRDALLLFSAALDNQIPMINRRPHDKERATAIQSGNIFIYCENTSNIKRWTDGVTWSPSRIMGNFLIYRELNKGFPPGEKKRATKRKLSDREYDDSDLPPIPLTKEQERSLIGSLIDSYDFKKEGLVKKTISVKIDEQTYHMVSYYSVRDAVNERHVTPSLSPQFMGVPIRPELLSGQVFRVSVDVHGNDVGNGSPSPRNSVSISPRGSISHMGSQPDHLSTSSDDQEDEGIIPSHQVTTNFVPGNSYQPPNHGYTTENRYGAPGRDAIYSSNLFDSRYVPVMAAGGPSSHETLGRHGPITDHTVPRGSIPDTLPPLQYAPFERRYASMSQRQSYDTGPQSTYSDTGVSRSYSVDAGAHAHGHNLDGGLAGIHHKASSFSEASYTAVHDNSYSANSMDHGAAYPRRTITHGNEPDETGHPEPHTYHVAEESVHYPTSSRHTWM